MKQFHNVDLQVKKIKAKISPLSLPFKPNPLMIATRKVLKVIAVGSMCLATSSTFAQLYTQDQDDSQTNRSTNKLTTDTSQQNDPQNKAPNNEPTITLPKITVIAKSESNPAYAGGQVTSTNHMGFLGNKDFLETPFNAVSYTKDYIKDRQAGDITDVIAATDPSVYTSGVSGQNLESFKIRGFDSNISDVTVGGLYGVAPRYRSSPEMFERIEVLKGPSAMLNGMAPNGSVGGAINLVTKRADDVPLTQVTVDYLSDSQVGGHVDIGRRFGDNKQFGARFNGVYRDGDTAINNQTKKTRLAALGVDWKGDRIRLSGDLYDSNEYTNGPTRGLNLAPGVPLPNPPSSDTLLNPDWAFNDSQDKGASVRGEFDINDDMMFYASLGYGDNTFKSRSAAVSVLKNTAGDYETLIGDLKDTVEKKSGEIGLKGSFETGSLEHQLALNITAYKENGALAGNFYRDNLINNNFNNLKWPSYDDVPFTDPELLRTQSLLSSYGLADTLSFNEGKYQLTLGLRHQRVETKQSGLFGTGKDYDESETTPSVAFIAKLKEGVSIYGNYIEGLTKGTTAPVAAVNAGEVFAPFKTKQKELGIKVDSGDFSNTLSAFVITKPTDYIDPISKRYSVDGKQQNRGLEWSFFGSPIQDVRLIGGITYIDAKIEKATNKEHEGNQAADVPKWQAKLGAEWDQPYIPNLTLTANVNALSEQYINNDNKLSLPGRTLLDLGARYKTSIGQYPLTIRSTINNVTNKSYWAKPHYTSLGIGDPRTFMLSATMDF